MKRLIALLLISSFCGLTLVGCGETSEVNNESDMPSEAENAESVGISSSKGESQKPIKAFASYSGDYLEFEKEYDVSGNILVDKDFSDSWSWVEYTYDNNENILTKTEYKKSGKYSLCEYTYDSNGNVLTETDYGEEGEYSISEYTYINQKKYPAISIINLKKYNADGTLAEWTEPTYDDNGNLQKNITYEEDGSISMWDEYTYNSEGNMLTDCCYKGDGTLTSQSEYTYEDEGYKFEKTAYSTQSYNGILYVIVDLYDKNGNISTERMTEYDGNGIFLDYEYTYDSDGNIMTKLYYNNKGFLKERVEYTYDDIGGMTEKDEEYGLLKEETLDCYTESVYDKIGNLRDRTETHYEIDGSVISHYHSIYDEWGHCLGVDNDSNTCDFIYDDIGNLLEIVQYDSELRDTIRYTTELIYDNDGKLQTVLSYGRNADTLRNKYEYTYDSDGCPLVKTIYDEEEYPTSNIAYEYY